MYCAQAVIFEQPPTTLEIAGVALVLLGCVGSAVENFWLHRREKGRKTGKPEVAFTKKREEIEKVRERVGGLGPAHDEGARAGGGKAGHARGV